MNLIKKASPNFNGRFPDSDISILMIHATGCDLDESLKFLIDGSVSCHYVIDENGDVYHLVDEDKRAWHAGVGYWQGVTDINSASIGIELVKPSDDEIVMDGAKLPEKQFHNCFYSQEQMSALLELSKDVLSRNEKIKPHNVIPHQSASVDRKFDPGKNFDWQHLADSGVGLWHDLSAADMAEITPISKVEEQDCLNLFNEYGYDLRDTSESQVKNVVTAFQTHFLPTQISGTITAGTYKAIQSLTKKIS